MLTVCRPGEELSHIELVKSTCSSPLTALTYSRKKPFPTCEKTMVRGLQSYTGEVLPNKRLVMRIVDEFFTEVEV